jgi:tetratricopeptide (TPR) repeat protein
MAALNYDQIGELISKLLNSPGLEPVKLVLEEYSWLLSTEVDQALTQMITNRRQKSNLRGVAFFTAVRGVLRRCRSEGVEATLANQSGWPLAQHGSLTQLLALADTASPDLRIEWAELALRDVELETEPDIYGLIEYNLGLGYHSRAIQYLNGLILMGNVYLNRIEGERLINLKRGLDFFERAYTLAAGQPAERLGEIEHNLAIAYRVCLHGQPADNYEKAKKLAEKALKRFDRRLTPENWAKTTAELATIYAHRQRGARAENLEKAIQYDKQALEVYRQKTYPRQWALVRLHLGNLYCDRLVGAPADNYR